jgi:AcrR family transcriptional regulator
MNPRPDVSAERKPQILQAAAQVFLRKGFTAARMEDIAREAGLSVGNLYRYFENKLEITLALMDLFLEPSLHNLESLIIAPGTCRARLEGSFLLELQALDTAALTLYSDMYHLAHREERVRRLLADYNARYQQGVAVIIAQGIQRGELRPVDPASAAFTFQSIFDGLMQNLLLIPESLDLPTALRQTFDILFDGLEQPNSSPSMSDAPANS